MKKFAVLLLYFGVFVHTYPYGEMETNLRIYIGHAAFAGGKEVHNPCGDVGVFSINVDGADAVLGNALAGEILV